MHTVANLELIKAGADFFYSPLFFSSSPSFLLKNGGGLKGAPWFFWGLGAAVVLPPPLILGLNFLFDLRTAMVEEDSYLWACLWDRR